jgi:hypothetical protein
LEFDSAFVPFENVSGYFVRRVDSGAVFGLLGEPRTVGLTVRVKY